MQVTAKWLGLTYEEWNVILFVIIHPLLTLTILLFLLRYRYKYIELNRQKHKKLPARIKTKING